MASIKLDFWETPNFPPLDILESRTKTVLEAFNKCRKLDIKLQTNENDSRIKAFSLLFNSLTERRAIESLRLSMFAEDVVVYIKLLSEENTSIGVILETLSTLLDAAEDRKEITARLKDDYQGFLKRFDEEVANGPKKFANLPSSSNGEELGIVIVKRNEVKKLIILEVINVAIPILFGYGVFKFSRNPNLRHFLSKYPFLSIYSISSILFLGGQNDINKIEEMQNGDSSNNDSTRENEISENDKESIEVDEHHPSVPNPFDGSSMGDGNLPSWNWVKTKVWGVWKDWKSRNPNSENVNQVDQSPSQEASSSSSPSKALSTMVMKKDQSPFQGTSSSSSLPTSNSDDINNKQDTDFSNQIITPVSQTLDNLPSVTNLPSSDTSDSINVHISQYLFPGIFSVFLGYLMWKFLRKTKAKQYQWVEKFWNKGFKPKSRKALDEQRQIQINAKGSKILEVTEKLPVIIQNVEILDQFWDNQIINIKSHIETLKSVNENEKIKIPQNLATPIIEYWHKQVDESKTNFIRTKDLVTRNSLLAID